KQWGGTANDRATAIAVSGGDLYVAGITSSTISDFDGHIIDGEPGQGFLARASAATGVAAMVRTIPASVDLNGLAVIGDNVLLGGSVRAALSLGGCGITPSGTGSDGLLVMFTGSTLGCQ